MRQPTTKSTSRELATIGAIPAYLTLLRQRPAWLASARNGLLVEFGEATIYSDRAPTPTQRAELEVRTEALRDCLSPSFDNDARKAVAMLIATLPSQGADGATMAIRGDAFRTVLEDQPGWAVKLACRSFLFGERRVTFCPPPHVVREACQEETAKMRQELEESELILRARAIEPPKARARDPNALKWSDLTDEDRVGDDPAPMRSPGITDQFLEELRARMERRKRLSTEEAA